MNAVETVCSGTKLPVPAIRMADCDARVATITGHFTLGQFALYAGLPYALSTAFRRGGPVARRDTYGPVYRAIIEKLVSARRAAGMTQTDLGQALGTDQSQISKIERAERRLDIVDYVRICRALGIDPGAPLRDISF
jgi:DNA-binding XRE family transcriptional regulator